jgi:hypothetical protein
MKSLFLLAVATAPLLLTSCVVERDVVYHRRPYPYRREVVVAPAPVGVVYYTDVRGRYYWRHHRRVYVAYY